LLAAEDAWDFLIQGRSATEAAVQPETRYARLGNDRIAYQVLGHGPPDLVMTTGGFSQIDIIWEDPGIALFLRTLASFSRLILFDRRGTGASDPLPPDPLPPWEAYAEELAVVLDEVGSERAALLAQIDAGPLALYFAASRPERTSALVLAHTTARFVATDDYPIGVAAEVAEAVLDQVDQLWGSEALAGILMPSRAGDERFRRWFAKLQRTGASPRAAKALLGAALEVDARPILPLIHAPTLVLHRRDAHFIPVQHASFLAEHIPGAKLVELPGSDLSLMWETREQILDLIEEFLTGVRRVPPPRRVLATVLFTDIVGSTKLASRLRDRRWRELLDTHDDVSRQTVEEFNGRLVETTGDGILATFDGPGRGIGCAAALRDQVRGIGLQLREGLHTGEVELRNGDVGGVGVHIAARVMDAAQPGEILASRTVRDLVVGSDVILEDRGIRRLKGVDGRWQLYAVTRP
jgi:class 3 adenylate cyclase